MDRHPLLDLVLPSHIRARFPAALQLHLQQFVPPDGQPAPRSNKSLRLPRLCFWEWEKGPKTCGLGSRIKGKSVPASKDIANSHSVKKAFVELLEKAKNARLDTDDLKQKYEVILPALDRMLLQKTNKKLRKGGGDAVIEDIGERKLEDVMLSLVLSRPTRLKT